MGLQVRPVSGRRHADQASITVSAECCGYRASTPQPRSRNLRPSNRKKSTVSCGSPLSSMSSPTDPSPSSNPGRCDVGEPTRLVAPFPVPDAFDHHPDTVIARSRRPDR